MGKIVIVWILILAVAVYPALVKSWRAGGRSGVLRSTYRAPSPARPSPSSSSRFTGSHSTRTGSSVHQTVFSVPSLRHVPSSALHNPAPSSSIRHQETLSSRTRFGSSSPSGSSTLSNIHSPSPSPSQKWGSSSPTGSHPASAFRAADKAVTGSAVRAPMQTEEAVSYHAVPVIIKPKVTVIHNSPSSTVGTGFASGFVFGRMASASTHQHHDYYYYNRIAANRHSDRPLEAPARTGTAILAASVDSQYSHVVSSTKSRIVKSDSTATTTKNYCTLARWNMELPFSDLPNIALRLLIIDSVSGLTTTEKSRFMYEFLDGALQSFGKEPPSADSFQLDSSLDLSKCSLYISGTSFTTLESGTAASPQNSTFRTTATDEARETTRLETTTLSATLSAIEIYTTDETTSEATAGPDKNGRITLAVSSTDTSTIAKTVDTDATQTIFIETTTLETALNETSTGISKETASDTTTAEINIERTTLAHSSTDTSTSAALVNEETTKHSTAAISNNATLAFTIAPSETSSSTTTASTEAAVDATSTASSEKNSTERAEGTTLNTGLEDGNSSIEMTTPISAPNDTANFDEHPKAVIANDATLALPFTKALSETSSSTTTALTQTAVDTASSESSTETTTGLAESTTSGTSLEVSNISIEMTTPVAAPSELTNFDYVTAANTEATTTVTAERFRREVADTINVAGVTTFQSVIDASRTKEPFVTSIKNLLAKYSSMNDNASALSGLVVSAKACHSLLLPEKNSSAPSGPSLYSCLDFSVDASQVASLNNEGSIFGNDELCSRFFNPETAICLSSVTQDTQVNATCRLVDINNLLAFARDFYLCPEETRETIATETTTSRETRITTTSPKTAATSPRTEAAPMGTSACVEKLSSVSAGAACMQMAASSVLAMGLLIGISNARIF